MNKIAIFGDSFAARIHEQIVDDEHVDMLKKVYKKAKRKFNVTEVPLFSQKWGNHCKPWMDYLDADVYGWIGSDLYYSYNQFINNHEKYEKCIFIITGKCRYSSQLDNNWMHCVGMPEAHSRSESDTSFERKSYYKNLLNFFKNIYFEDLERVNLIHQAMINSILSIRPDTIVIDSLLLEIVYKFELEAWDISYKDFSNLETCVDLRQCHMTNDNNYIFASYILDNLNTNGYLDLSNIQWKTPSMNEKDYYLIKFENLFGELF